MAKSTYPYAVDNPVLRTCRQGKHRVAVSSMCRAHARTCLTCCGLHRRGCDMEPWEVPSDPYFPQLTWEERQVEKAKLNRELGFRDYTEAELAEDEHWRVIP